MRKVRLTLAVLTASITLMSCTRYRCISELDKMPHKEIVNSPSTNPGK